MRAPLAELLRRPELLDQPVWADDVELTPDTRIGSPPLVSGVSLTSAARNTMTRRLWHRVWHRLDRDAPRTSQAPRVSRATTRAATTSTAVKTDTDSHGANGTSPPGRWALITAVCLPVLVSISMALMMRSAVFALFGLMGLVTVLPQQISAWRQRASARESPPHSTAPRLVAAREDPTNPWLPNQVALTSLLGRSPRDCVAPGTWWVPLGQGADGQVVGFDLVNDGPHLLIAGTTGSGKSAMLQSFILALAARHSPTELSLALVDFKGGASFGPCAGLPHVVGQVTDLDDGLASRALAGMRAELRYRKEVLARHSVADLRDLPPGTLPRLVLIIDEFRALAEDFPDLIPGLLRIAAQGRSLGVHLVLATQRSQGAVSPDVRANVSTRLALRVVDVADSHDLVGVDDAARIAADIPGRAVLRIGSTAPLALQCAFADAAQLPVSRVDKDSHPAILPDSAHRLVSKIAESYPPDSPWSAPWLPPLPMQVSLSAVSPLACKSTTELLPFALGDSPASQTRTPIIWNPGRAHLAILGGASTGKTGTLETLAAVALMHGWHVHALVSVSDEPRFARFARHPNFGTLAGPGDVRRAKRLLHLLATSRAGPADKGTRPRTLVVCDDVEQLRLALASGSGAGTTDPLLTALAVSEASFALAGSSANLSGLTTRCGPRLVLLSPDTAGDTLLGAPRTFTGRVGGDIPGRGVWLAGTEPLECQVATPAEFDELQQTASNPANTPNSPAPLRIVPLPTLVLPAEVRGHRSVIGIGGDQAEPVELAVNKLTGFLVAGPPGSGRSMTLRLLAKQCPAFERGSIFISRDPLLNRTFATLDGTILPPSPAGLADLVDKLDALQPAGTNPPTVMLDDVDQLTFFDAGAIEKVAWLATEGAIRVVASTTTEAASLAHRGLLAYLRAARNGIVLHPDERGASDVFRTSLNDAEDPGVQVPGRGALVLNGHVTPVQLLAPGDHDGAE